MEQSLREISICSGDTEAKIAPQRGGLVTSFRINGSEIFYLDPETFMDLTKNVRGGIPLLFPNAGPSKGYLYSLPQHGFVRKMSWQVAKQNGNSLILQLLSNAETKIYFPFDFELKLTVAVTKNKLTHTLTMTNLSDKPMPTAYGTHPYFNIAQSDKQKLIANIDGFNPKVVNWQNGFDQSFANPGSLRVEMPDKEFILDSDPAIFRFIQIWHLVGKDFICIEPWTRDALAIDDPNKSLWVKPHESINLPVVVRAIIKQ
jgi:galactose mutarotase-like enzyme